MGNWYGNGSSDPAWTRYDRLREDEQICTFCGTWFPESYIEPTHDDVWHLLCPDCRRKYDKEHVDE